MSEPFSSVYNGGSHLDKVNKKWQWHSFLRNRWYQRKFNCFVGVSAVVTIYNIGCASFTNKRWKTLAVWLIWSVVKEPLMSLVGYAYSFLVSKHREPQSINATLFLPIMPIAIVAYAFTLLWDNLCRNSSIYTGGTLWPSLHSPNDFTAWATFLPCTWNFWCWVSVFVSYILSECPSTHLCFQ